MENHGAARRELYRVIIGGIEIEIVHYLKGIRLDIALALSVPLPVPGGNIPVDIVSRTKIFFIAFLIVISPGFRRRGEIHAV